MEPINTSSSSDKDRDMMTRKSFEVSSETESDKKKKKKSLLFELGEPTQQKEKAETKAPKQEAGPEKPFTFNLLKREVETVSKDTTDVQAEKIEPFAAGHQDNSPENMTDDEARTAVQKLTEARTAELVIEQSQVEPGSAQEAAVDDNIEFIKAVQEHAKTASADEAIDAAYAEMAEKVDEAFAESGDELPPMDAERGSSDDKYDPTLPATNYVRTPPPVPSTPPSSPFGSGGPPGGRPPTHMGSPDGMSSSNRLTAPNTATNEPEVEYVRRGSRSGDLLVGGIIGYMIGRRGGRIRTEERLVPIQENLKRQVVELQDNIAEKEQKIRDQAIQKAEVLAKANREKVNPPTRGFLESAQPSMDTQTRRSETLPLNDRLPIPNEIPSISNEALGTTGANSFEQSRPSVETSPSPEAPPVETLKPVNQLTVPELLKVAENIEINGITAKEMYESRRLDAVNLRRVVGEYLRGSNFERTLKDQLKAEEGRRERSVESRPGQLPTNNTNAPAIGSVGMSPAWNRGPDLPSVTSATANAQSTNYTPSEFAPKQQSNVPLWLVVAVGLGLLIAIALIVII